MKPLNQPIELIVSMPAVRTKAKEKGTLQQQLEKAGIPVKKIVTSRYAIRPKSGLLKKGVTSSDERLFVKTSISDSEMNPWDVAHISSNDLGNASFVEPDLWQEFVVDRNADIAYKKKKAGQKAGDDASGFDPDWQPHKNIVWHLDDTHSQLRAARALVESVPYTVRIAHLDTGYDKNHNIIPPQIKKHPLQRNFVDGENITDAHDPLSEGMLRMPGHGTGTLGILAGGKIKLTTSDGTFDDYLGGAYLADVFCCRVAKSVVLMKSSAFSEAINYLINLNREGTPIHIVSMSMGGAPSKTWAEAVNAAYEEGITMVTASGNNFNGLPTRHIVYPARFQRVIAACGATWDHKPYRTKKLGEMQGCFGPRRHMNKALAAYTPNIPWAKVDSGGISFAGAGTSSATPQIAAAAALYYKMHHKALDALQPWQRVEAIRNALYRSARKEVKGEQDYRDFFGNGILQANDALSQRVHIASEKTPPDKIPLFPILGTIFKSPKATLPKSIEMYNTELAQLIYYHIELSEIIGNEEKPFGSISQRKWETFKDAVIAHPDSSLALKKFLSNGA